MIPGQTQPIRPIPPPSTPGGTQQIAFTQAQQQLMVQAMQQQQQQQQQQHAPQGGMPRPPLNQNLAALQNAHRAGLVQANNMRLQMPQNQAAAAAAAQMAQRASQSPATSAAQVQNLPNMVRPAPPPGTHNSPRSLNPAMPQQRPPMSGNPTQGGAPRPNANAALSSSVGQHLMNLMREAGISSMNQIPVPEHPSGGQWTAEQIKMYRMSQLQVS